MHAATTQRAPSRLVSMQALACSIEHIVQFITKPSPGPVETFLPGCQKMRQGVCGDLQTQEAHLEGEGRQSVELPVG